MAPVLRILAGLLLGLVTGALLLSLNLALGTSLVAFAKLVGGLWINALRMTVIPLILALIVSGVTSALAVARAGRMTARVIVSFIFLLAVAGTLGAICSTTLLSIWVPSPDAAAALIASIRTEGSAIPAQPPASELLRGIIPPNAVEAAANGTILPFVVFALFLGFAIGGLADEPQRTLRAIFEALAEAMLRIVSWVLRVAPIGVFALAVTLAATSLNAAGLLLHYLMFICCIASLGTAAAYLLVLVASRGIFVPFVKHAAPAQVVAISTQSSLASLPVMLEGASNMGVSQRVASLVLPLAVSMFRFTNPLVNVSIALYAANLYGVPISALTVMLAVATAVLMHFSSVGVSSQVTFFTSLVPIFDAVGVPLEVLAIFIALETIPDMFRTLGNVSMDLAVTCALDRSSVGSAASGISSRLRS